MEIIIYRGTPMECEDRQLPATLYNLARTIQARSTSGVVFAPVRSMQILAIMDAEEFVFVDSQFRHLAVLAWQAFQPQRRDALDMSVPYVAAYHRPDGREIQKRLQGELFRTLETLAAKATITGPARILKFPLPTPGGS